MTKAESPEFGTANFVVMGVFLVATLGIGVFYGVRGKSSRSLLISRNMSVAPVSLSMMATFLSAILIVGTPSEIFYFGLEWYACVFAFPCGAIISAVVFQPVFFPLGLTSVYEYLGLRYGTQWMTRVGTVAFMTQNLLYTGIALYAPSIVLSNVTGLSSAAAIFLVGLVGTSYTAFGGFKAVIWADVLQAVIMVIGVLAIIIQGCVNVGGFTQMMDINREHGRLTMFSWKLDPLQRHNFWNTFFGQLVMWSSLLGVNQPAVQRLFSLPTYKKAALTSVISGFLMVIMISLAVFSGLSIFATYAEADPLKTGVTQRRDELVPHFVADQLGHVPGLGGLFIACVLSGALSTISSSLNSLATVTWEDFFRHCDCFSQLGDRATRWVLRGIALLYGLISIGLAFLAGKMGGVLQVAVGVYGGCTGPILGLFCMALFVPFSNPTGATSGLVVGLILALWASFGASFSGVSKPVMLPTLPAETLFNSTSAAAAAVADETVEKTGLEIFYSISYMLYSLLGFLATTVTGIVVSAITGGSKTRVESHLLSPAVRCLAQKKKYRLDHHNGKANTGFEMEQQENGRKDVTGA